MPKSTKRVEDLDGSTKRRVPRGWGVGVYSCHAWL